MRYPFLKIVIFRGSRHCKKRSPAPKPQGRAEQIVTGNIIFVKKYDEMSLPKQKPENIPYVEIAYAVKVIPEQDLTIYQNTSGSYYWEGGEKYTRTQMYVVDDTGEEQFNKSIDPRDDYIGLAILDNKTYRTFSGNMQQMFIPQATIVQFSFSSMYGWPMGMRMTFNNQDIILDEQHNITLARYENHKFVS
jgi:hypothetical protein